MSNISSDNGIPVLTEVISPPTQNDAGTKPVGFSPAAPTTPRLPASPATTAQQQTPSTAATPAIATHASPAVFPSGPLPIGKNNPAPSEAQLLARWSDEEWRRLERDIKERLSHQIFDRIEVELNQRVRDSLADVLQLAVEGLATDIKCGLQDNLEELVAHAVALEIARLRTTKN